MFGCVCGVVCVNKVNVCVWCVLVCVGVCVCVCGVLFRLYICNVCGWFLWVYVNAWVDMRCLWLCVYVVCVCMYVMCLCVCEE